MNLQIKDGDNLDLYSSFYEFLLGSKLPTEVIKTLIYARSTSFLTCS